MSGRPSQDSTDLPLMCDKRLRRRRHTLGAHMLSLTLMAQLPSISSAWGKKRHYQQTQGRAELGISCTTSPFQQNQKNVAPHFGRSLLFDFEFQASVAFFCSVHAAGKSYMNQIPPQIRFLESTHPIVF